MEAAPAKKRVLVAGLYHQTNSFVGGRTGLEDFEVRRGGEMLRAEDVAPPLAALADTAGENGWELLPVVDMRAAAGATVADAVVDLFWAEFRAVADREADGGVDGVFLVVHGSMVSESLQDVEGEVLRRIRGLGHLSDVPVCGVMDPRVNFTEAMGRQSDGLVAHRENPPTATHSPPIRAHRGPSTRPPAGASPGAGTSATRGRDRTPASGTATRGG